MSRLAIISTHPIQYNAPLFKLLASQPGLEVKVFYTLGKNYTDLKDKGFGKTIIWDIPLLDGYEYEFLNNTSATPGTSHFKGVVNPSILEIIKTFKPTALLVYGWSFDSHLKVLRHFKNKVPIYFRGDSTLLDEKRGVKVIFRKLALQWVYKHIDKALYVGSRNKQYFIKYGIKEQSLVFAPHAVDNERFADDNQYLHESRLIRADLGIPEKNTVFLFIGKFENKKKPLLLLKAFKNISQENVSLLFVGNGDLEAKLKEEAKEFSEVYFLPFQNQKRMPAIYRSAEILVLPSSGPGETWGLCVNEAMASGLPIIVSNKVGCAVDLVKDGQNGFVFESDSVSALINAFSTFAQMPSSQIKAMGKISRTIINDWSFKNICEAIVEELDKEKQIVIHRR
jgi:glycosyltransferase involved in cell wall biosynthesis